MSLVVSLLLFVSLIIFFCMPFRLQFDISHQEQWSAALTIKFFLWHYTIQRTESTWREQSNHSAEHSIDFNWKSLLSMGRESVQILARYFTLEYLSIHCCIGWERADYTAYTYGLFWAAVSALPTHWLERSDIMYEPDFQVKRKDVLVQGIIHCTIAQLIGAFVALLRVILREMQMPNRREPIGL